MQSVYKQNTLVPESLYTGDHGSQVIQLQGKLSELGLYHGKITGQFDPQTQQALIAFQDQYGVAETGFVGPQTWCALAFWTRETGVSLFPEAIKKLFYRAQYVLCTYAEKLSA